MSKQFAEFLVDEFFEWDNGSRLNTDERIPGRTPFFTAGSENRGLYGYISNNAGAFHKPITIDMFGNCFYHPFEKCYGDDNVYFLERECSDRIKLYICSAISKAIQKLFSFATQFRKEQLRRLIIELPVTDTSASTDTPEPDWEYMENYIKTIEQKFIDQVARLDAREQKILQQLYPEAVKVKPEAHGFEEIRVGDIVTFSKGKRVTSADQVPGDVPYVTAATESNGIDAWIANPIFTDSNLATVNFFGKCYYHPYKIAHKDGTYGMKFSNLAGKNGRHYLYFMTALEKVSLKRGSFSKMLTDDLAAELHVRMPVTPTGDIDWDYMENYIAWIENQERESRKLRAAREEKILNWLHQQR